MKHFAITTTLLLFWLTSALSQNITNNTNTTDTIFQNYHRVDKIQPTNSEAVIRLLVMDFQKNALANMPLWVWNKKTNQYWSGETDQRGEVFFLLPNNTKYTVNLNQETDYRKFEIPKEKKLSKTFKVVCMSTRISETERNDTIFQQLAPGQMPTNKRVLVKIKISDLNNQPLPKEALYYVSEKTKKVYSTLTNSQGRATLMLPKGDTYKVHSDVFQNITSKTYEDRPSSRTSTFELKTISTIAFKEREKERALFLAQRDSLQAAQRSRDSVRIAEMDGYNFYLQHYYAKRDFKKIETNVIKTAQKDRVTLAANPDFYTENRQEIRAMLYRNKNQWKQKRIVANIDCSMYQYIDELLVWNYTDELEQKNNTYWLFNGFQNKAEKSTSNHYSRGIYHVEKNDVEGFCNTIDKIVSFSCGGNRMENVVEALIIGSKDKTEAEELIFIADNYSDVSDLHQLKNLNTPVRVLLTASHAGINEQYLEIAYKTGGSVHTRTEDISKEQLKALQDGERLKIGKYAYQFLRGRFLKV